MGLSYTEGGGGLICILHLGLSANKFPWKILRDKKSVFNQLFSVISGKVHNHDFYHDLPDNLRYTGAGYGHRPYAGFQPGLPLRHTYPRRHYGTTSGPSGAPGVTGVTRPHSNRLSAR